jgi:Pregnancy-associated plasma protein-A
MKKMLCLVVFIQFQLNAQDKQVQLNDCGTKLKSGVKKISKESMSNFLTTINTISEPYSISIYFTVFADNDGTNRASNDADIIRQFNNMVNQFKPHGICFTLMGIRQINNSDYNIQDVADEEGEMVGIRETNFFNIFIHKTLIDGSQQLNGNAYDIPNPYSFISLWGGAISSTSNLSTMAHELGHAIGLYHTFEIHSGDPFHGAENVARTGNCSDCDNDGDLICDTPADPNDSGEYLSLNTNSFCVYTGSKVDNCGWQYAPLTNNLMTYGIRSCRTIFTTGQANRMKYFLSTEPAFNSVIAPNTMLVNVAQTISSDNKWGVARDIFTIQPSSGLITINGTTNLLIQSKKIQVNNGTKFSPSSGGRIHLKVNPYCN